MGWATTEELRYSDRGALLTHSPNNYKIPSVECLPSTFHVAFLEGPDDPTNLLGSKAVGEPPFVLGISVWAAVKQALSPSGPSPGRSPSLALPATSEEILRHLTDRDEPGPATTITARTEPDVPEETETRAILE
jgi:xanthine dehydrogenase large subunit